MKLGLLVCLCFLFVPSIPTLLLAFPDGPLPALTGGFGEKTCVACHNSFPLNEGRTQGGTFHLVNVPQTYKKGVTYSDHCLDRPTRSIPMGI